MKFSKMKEKRRAQNRRNPKSMLKGQKKGKPNKDKRHFNGTAVNHTDSALWREPHKGKGKKTKRNMKNKSSPVPKIYFWTLSGWLSFQ